MRQSSGFLASLRNGLFVVLLLAGMVYAGFEFLAFRQLGNIFSPGVTIAEIDVSGLTQEEARTLIASTYAAPVVVIHQDMSVDIDPADAGFQIAVDNMIAEAVAQQSEKPVWQQFGLYLLDRPVAPITVPLSATHDPAQLTLIVQAIADFLDQPALAPQFKAIDMTVIDGADGYRTNVAASLPAISSALYSTSNRVATLEIISESTPSLDIAVLADFISNQLSTFSGDGSFYIYNLTTGEEVMVSADRAMSGTSTMKIAIVLESLRAVDDITLDQRKLISETLTFSGNYSANLLLDIVAGQDNAYLGSDILTGSMHALGLLNTFIATPYEEPPRPNVPTVVTPANLLNETIIIDPAMQTTAEDVGILLSMVYYCSQGSGALLALYGDTLTPAECEELINFLAQNEDGRWLVSEGVPTETIVAHKHGWIDGNTGLHGMHSDAAIVFSPSGPYVIVGFLYDVGWLDWEVTGPLMRTISQAAYNYFNPDAPFEGHNEDTH